ncbi:MAG: OmpA family protein [Gammaproteobacteria bacterium]|nr:MAG: OmpA family protein [Gammaproteobacteria bacterium]
MLMGRRWLRASPILAAVRLSRVATRGGGASLGSPAWPLASSSAFIWSAVMSHVAMKISRDVTVAPSSRVKPVARVLAMITAMFLSLSACETMKDTMDSINIFNDDEKASSSTADANSLDITADPRKNAVVRAGVEPVSPESVGYYMDQQEAKLHDQLSGTGVTVMRVGQTIVLSMPGSATFASGSSDVDSKFYPVLDSVVVVLDEFNQTYVDVIGHTDSKGSKEYNQRLSEKRARSVAHYLESRAVISERVAADGMGEADPIAGNDTREGRAMNRRVEIKLTPVT